MDASIARLDIRPLGLICTFFLLAADSAALAANRVGADSSNLANPVIQPQDRAQSGNNRNQTLNNGDVVRGTRRNDILEGRLGADVLEGLGGDDVLIGGLEHFTDTDQRIDRAFGGRGSDIFLWKPGDGTDFLDGGSGTDAVVLGIVGEPDPADPSKVSFQVLDDNQAGEVFIDPDTKLPLIDVTNSPGFCPILDGADVKGLDVDHIAQFVLRGVRNDFENGVQNHDNGLRVSLHLKNVEFVICASRDGSVVEAFDLRKSPPKLVSIRDISSRKLRRRLARIVE